MSAAGGMVRGVAPRVAPGACRHPLPPGTRRSPAVDPPGGRCSMLPRGKPRNGSPAQCHGLDASFWLAPSRHPRGWRALGLERVGCEGTPRLGPTCAGRDPGRGYASRLPAADRLRSDPSSGTGCLTTRPPSPASAARRISRHLLAAAVLDTVAPPDRTGVRVDDGMRRLECNNGDLPAQYGGRSPIGIAGPGEPPRVRASRLAFHIR